MKNKTKRRTALYTTVSGLKGKVKQLTPMFMQDGKWYPMSKLKEKLK